MHHGIGHGGGDLGMGGGGVLDVFSPHGKEHLPLDRITTPTSPGQDHPPPPGKVKVIDMTGGTLPTRVHYCSEVVSVTF